MLKIVIANPEVREMKGVGKTSGKPYHMRFQSAHAFTVDKSGVMAEYPDKFELQLDDGQIPYAKGEYKLSPNSLYVSRDGRLECRPRLMPFKVA